MNKLIIVGNGFDLHHGLPTTYKGFGEYLREHDLSLLDDIDSLISFPQEDDDIWSRFEDNLAHIDMDYLDERIIEYVPSPSSDEYNTDIGACIVEAERLVRGLTTDLRYQFANYISKANAKDVQTSKLLNIDSDSLFISFNYTTTLERFYNIDKNRVLYIHGTCDCEGSIILGHATDPETFAQDISNDIMPSDVSEEEQQMWEEEMSNQYVPFLDEARENLASYYSKSYKDSDQIIEKNKVFFEQLLMVNSIHILGHSMSEVDFLYFEILKRYVQIDCFWYVSYYSEEDRENIISVLESLGIAEDKCALFRLDNILASASSF